MGQLALSAAGGVIGAFVGGPVGAQVGFALGGLAGRALFGGGQDQVNEGPRLRDLSVQLSKYNTPIPRIHGAFRVPGNVVWARPIHEIVSQEEVQGGKGGGGPEVTNRTYSYYGTWNSLMCLGPAVGVSRIWFDNKLMCDVRSYAPLATRQASAAWLARYVTIYLGTDTQTPDPIMEAYEGAGKVPAMLGQVYLMFNFHPLADFGNRIPSVTAEIYTAGSGDISLFTYKAGSDGDYTNDMNHSEYDPVLGRYLSFSTARDSAYTYPAVATVFDVNTRTFIRLVQYTSNPANRANGTMFNSGDSGSPPNQFCFLSKRSLNFHDLATGDWIRGIYLVSDNVWAWVEEVGNFVIKHLIPQLPSSNGTVKAIPKNATVLSEIVTQGNPPSPWVKMPTYKGIPGEGFAVWALRNLTTGVMAFARFTPTAVSGGGTWGTIKTTIYQAATYTPGVFVYDSLRGHLWGLYQSASPINHWLFHIDNDGTLLEAPIDLGNLGNFSTVEGNQSIYYDEPSDSVLIHLNSSNAYLFNLADRSLKTLAVGIGGDHPAYDSARCEMYECAEQYPIDPGVFLVSHVVELGCTDPNCETVPNAVSAICTNAGLDPGKVDVSQLTGKVCIETGRQTGRGAIENIAAGAFFDGVESQGKLRFIPRGLHTGVTIDQEHMLIPGDGGDPLKITRDDEVELPRRVSIGFFQRDKNYQEGEAHQQRLVTKSVKEDGREVRLALTAAEAANVADVALWELWAAQLKFSWALPIEFYYLDPGDVITVTKEGLAFDVKITSLSQESLIRLNMTGEQTHPPLYDPNAFGAGGPPDNATVEDIGETTGLLLDVPMLSPSHNDARKYNAIGGQSDGWMGGRIYESTDGGQNFKAAQKSDVSATIGVIAAALADGITHTWDTANSFTVVLEHPELTLESFTDLAILNGANAAAIGKPGRWEVVQFALAQLGNPSEYTCSRLLRGRLGTEHNTANHEADDWFVLLTGAGIGSIITSLAELNSQRDYKAVSVGQDIADVTAFADTYTGVNLKPWSPVKITGSRDGSNNLTINWIRRSRFAARNFWRPILGEASERYFVDILSGSTVLRTFDVTTTQAVYTAAQQTTDGLTPGDPVEVSIQMFSDTVGRGYPGVATI